MIKQNLNIRIYLFIFDFIYFIHLLNDWHFLKIQQKYKLIIMILLENINI
jgi:hypothetical protein